MAVKPSYTRVSPVGDMYRMAMVSSSLTTATGQVTGTLSYAVWALKWQSAAANMLVSSVEVDWSLATTFTTAQDLAFGLFVVRGQSSTANSGGTLATIGTSTISYMQALDSNMGASLLASAGEIRMATTGAVTVTTGTIDTYPIKVWSGGINNTQIAGMINGANRPFRPGDRPDTQQLWLRNNEGLVIQPLYTMGAAGVIHLYVTIEWAEVGPNYT